MELKQISIHNLTPYVKNPRKNDLAVAAVKASIKEFGFKVPILIDRGNVIVAGHTRLKAAIELGMSEVPCLLVDDLTDDQIKAFRILDNKVAEKSDWDLELLEIELSEIKLDMSGFDVEWPKFSSSEINEDTSQDDIPAITKDVTTKFGDVWALGCHTLVCGDSTEFHKVAPYGPVSLVLTDPPYGVSYVGKTEEALEIENDSLDEKSLRDFWEKAVDAFLGALRPGGAIYVAVPPGPLKAIFVNELIKRQALRQELVWSKNSFVLGRSDYHYQHETILYGWRPGAGHYFIDDRTQSSLLEFDRPTKSPEHPTMKPLPLWLKLMLNSSRHGERVLDPFCGSGTSIIAAERLGRIAIGFEIAPAYCDVICQRFYNETKIVPTLVDTGVPFPVVE